MLSVKACADPGIFARGGGGGGVQAQLPENSSDTIFFKSSTNFTVLQRVSNGYLKENYNFSKVSEWVQHFPGGGGGGWGVGSNFFQRGGGGVQLLIKIETHITCDFPGGGGPDPLFPPRDPRMQGFCCI